MKELSEEELICIVGALVFIITEKDDPVPQHDFALSGQAYYEELIATASWASFHDVCSMEKPAYRALVDIVRIEFERLRNHMRWRKSDYLIHALWLEQPSTQ